MTLKTLITGAILAGAVLSSQPAAAYELTTTGRTLASPQLTMDVLRDIARYSKATGGCSFLFSADMRIMPRGLTPARPTIAADRRGGHFEQWTVNACGAKQRFQIAMWPSPRGGSDYAITPLTGRMPLYVR
ncbi:hypothetical protein NF701_04600 [Sphingomonadaceae bacterium OTU29THOMA1]|nr:hypothetical protein NF699_05970 [Sphingomonadaceae bacterium OTU29LAMAA1]USU13130.1 hypothetical protein NF701_04600 [Sphingomonadaceae bacterium OTU29THOMA1]